MYAMEHSGLRQSCSAFRTYAVGVLLVLLATVLRTVTSVTSNLISANVSVEGLCVDWLLCFELWWAVHWLRIVSLLYQRNVLRVFCSVMVRSVAFYMLSLQLFFDV
jgi:hypothetical protein